MRGTKRGRSKAPTADNTSAASRQSRIAEEKRRPFDPHGAVSRVTDYGTQLLADFEMYHRVLQALVLKLPQHHRRRATPTMRSLVERARIRLQRVRAPSAKALAAAFDWETLVQLLRKCRRDVSEWDMAFWKRSASPSCFEGESGGRLGRPSSDDADQNSGASGRRRAPRIRLRQLRSVPCRPR